MVLTKSGFLDYRQCPKSAWLKANRHAEVSWPAPDPFAQMLMQQGYEVEAYAKQLVASWGDADRCTFQVEFQTDSLEARADLIKRHADGEIDLFEIKSSTSIKEGAIDHIDDATFQTIVIERTGVTVRAAHLIHLDKNYIRSGTIDPARLLVLVDVTAQVRDRIDAIEEEVEAARAFLCQPALDESGCTCRFVGNPDNHCVTFERFNPGIAIPSVYILPRISAAKLKIFHDEDRFTLAAIEPHELSARQALVHKAALENKPVINPAGIAQFIDALEWPLYFYDYETFGSAVPIADGHRPHAQMPVQFSLHTLEASGTLTHHDHLSEAPGTQRELVEMLETLIGPSGNVISWNKGFEAACNTRMAALLPGKAGFLSDINARTRDLMDPFAMDYVDARFKGSTSIKNVLPVLVPSLAYSTTDVADGTGAMAAWLRLVSSADPRERADLRRQLLAYCRLDTLAMVEIFRVLREVAA